MISWHQQVVINNKLERRIIGVINEHKKQNNGKGVISGRLTAKKLQVFLQANFFKFLIFNGAFLRQHHIRGKITFSISIEISYTSFLPLRAGKELCEIQMCTLK